MKEMKAMKAMKAIKEMKIPKMKKEKSTKPRLENLWVNFLKDYAKSNGITYSCALSDPKAKEEYKTGKMVIMPMKEEPVMMTKKEQVMEMKDSKALKRTKKPQEKVLEKAPEKVSYRIQNKEIYNIIDDYMKIYNSINPRDVSQRERVIDEIRNKVNEYEKKTNSVLKKRGYDSIKDAFFNEVWFDRQDYDKKVDRLKKKLEKAQEK